MADRTAVVVNSADGRSSGAAELFDALYCRLFVHAYECLEQLAGDVEDFSAALVMVRPLNAVQPLRRSTLSRSVGEAHATRITAGRGLERRTFAMSTLLQLVRRTIRNGLCSMHVCVCAHACACVCGVSRNLSGGQRAACNRWSGISTARLHRLQRTSTCAIIRMD